MQQRRARLFCQRCQLRESKHIPHFCETRRLRIINASFGRIGFIGLQGVISSVACLSVAVGLL